MSDGSTLQIQSHKGTYTVSFERQALEILDATVEDTVHFIIDRTVADLYAPKIMHILNHRSVLLIDALESSKTIERIPDYVTHLVQCGLRRDHRLIAIGGGITQDITCFLAATMLRGVDWSFYPTTLLAQADSCIGSKSSINSASAKNILGTFLPPSHVVISTDLLASLAPEDIRSGVGEMLKVHVIDSPEAFDDIAADYDAIFSDPSVMERYIRRSLLIKQRYIERDEFDKGPRNIFNYGHSFGHAIEAATNFAIPHGIAVTIGMTMANFMAAQMGVGSLDHFKRMYPVMRSNYDGFEKTPIPLEPFLLALSKDKKNTGAGSATLILPDHEAVLFKAPWPIDDTFRTNCQIFFDTVRTEL